MAKFIYARKAMRARRITYRDLSKITGFSVGRLCAAVNGRPASDKVRRSMALALGMAYDVLWTEKGQQE
ncbi:MAG: hypothetical protein WB930_13780 [Syntrophobacteraceae bacterium]